VKALRFIQELLKSNSKGVAPPEPDKLLERKFNELEVFKYEDEGFTIEYENCIE